MPNIAPPADPPALQTSAFGLNFSNPVGLAAGMDKNALAINAWDALGFGFVEIGTITPQPQAGNPRPRIWRLPDHHAMVNRMGFPNDGMEAIGARFASPRSKSRSIKVAINIGPNRSTPPERIAEDFCALIRRLAVYADFLVINVSSPNTPGLRDFQSPERMRLIIKAIRQVCGETGLHPPLLLKLAPDLDAVLLAEICAVAMEITLAGIVATNTSLNHAAAGVHSGFEGGLSGEPLKLRAREMIGTIFRLTHGQLPIIGVGGIAGAADAYAHILAGAALVELYTGLVYQGPGLVARIKKELHQLLQRDGYRSIGDAIGRASL